MVENTVVQNRQIGLFDDYEEIWLFGYGSLIYHADFPWLERRPACIHHWARRFWQGSHDHRGTEEAPGRVVTLIAERGTICKGVAYLISPAVFAHLDHREKNGYLRRSVNICFAANGSTEGVVYVAGEDNRAFLGPASEPEIAQQIAVSAGPSGRNKEYLLALANALRKMQVEDTHVFAVERCLLDISHRDVD